MPIPTVITDLSTTAASNYPAGTEAPNVIDDTLRAHAAFIAQLYSGAAAGYGAANRIPYYNASTTVTTAAGFTFDGTTFTTGSWSAATHLLPAVTGTSNIGSASFEVATTYGRSFERATAGTLTISASNAAGAVQVRVAGSAAADWDANRNFIQKLNDTAPSLTVNASMTFELTSATQLKIFVRGGDGVTRSTSLTLA